MSDRLRVICSCGCENRVPVERRGSVVSCVACGNEVAVAKDAPVDASDPSSELDSVVSTSPGSTYTSSPFEEPVSEADFSTRFRRHETALYDPSIDERCSRCGRELRGEWDRLETATGIVCYVCANQGAAGTPDRLKARMEAERHTAEPVSRAYQPRAVVPVRRKIRARIARIAVAISAGAFLLSAFTIVIFDIELPFQFEGWSKPIAPSVHDVNKLPTLPWALFQVWQVVGGTVPVFIGVYVALFMNNSLPGKRFFQNLLYAAAYCVPFIVIRVMGIMTIWVHGTDPVYGALVIVLMGVAQTLAFVYIAFDLLEEGVPHCVYFVLIAVFGFLGMPYLDALIFERLRAF